MDGLLMRSVLAMFLYCQFRFHLSHAVGSCVLDIGNHFHSLCYISDSKEYDN